MAMSGRPDDTCRGLVFSHRSRPRLVASLIGEFQKIPGIGPVCAHVFDSYIQIPERFATKAQLWRYCGLAVTDRTSDNKPQGYRKLERTGSGVLKSVSYWAWKAAASTGKSNEVRAFFERSLQQTHDATHARLNTQRKLLSVMWTLWKHKEVYKPEKFSSSTAVPVPDKDGHGH